MRDAVICEPLRTPVGGFGGSLRDVPAHELAATVIRALVERTGLEPAAVDDVLLGHCYPTMEAPAIGRVAALDAGLPVTATGLQIDRRCGSGLQAVLYAAMQVSSGVSDVVLAGGAESMSNAPFYSTAMRWGVRGRPGRAAARRAGPRPGHRGRRELPGARRDDRDGREPAPRLRHLRGPSRTSSRCAATSGPPRHGRRAGSPTRSCPSPSRAGSDTVVDADEHIRPDSSVEALAGLRPIMGRADPEATVTAGNASAGRTTARPSASSRTRSGRPSWACARWSGWCPGASAGCRPRRWASGRCRPRRRRSPPPASPWPTST